MFGVGTTELLIVCFIALLLFGGRLPSVMRSLGGSIREFKRGMEDVQSDIKKSIEDAGEADQK
ncbi:MAG: Sec-independent protein translocase subunit TatA/TatB [Thermoguttaceae bacterium]